MKPWRNAGNALETVPVKWIVDVFDQEPGHVIPEAARKRLLDRAEQNDWKPFDEEELILKEMILPVDPDAAIVDRRADSDFADLDGDIDDDDEKDDNEHEAGEEDEEVDDDDSDDDDDVDLKVLRDKKRKRRGRGN